jgi:hypothetical protein
MCKALGFTFKEVNIEHHLLLIHRKITTDKSHTLTQIYIYKYNLKTGIIKVYNHTVTAVPLLCHFVSGNNWKHLNTKKESQCDYTHLISKYYINALSFATLGKEYLGFWIWIKKYHYKDIFEISTVDRIIVF